MANGVLSLIAAATQYAKVDFERKTHHPDAVQERFLQTLIKAHQSTVYGQKIGLSEIRTVDQFRDRLPILPYSSYEPYIERVAQGEPNILTPDPVVFLNLTSGSTGKQKLIPVTARSRRALAKANRTAVGFATTEARHLGKSLGKMLLTSSANPLGRTPGGILYGPVSTSHLKSVDVINRQVFAHPYEAMTIPDMLTRHYICLLFALANADLGIIAANFPVLALRLCEYLERYADALVHDLETGAIAPWLKIDTELRVRFERQWVAHPKRAAQLRSVLKADGRLTPHQAWPRTAFLITARGGTSNFYFERFPAYFGDIPIFGGIYSSAEATFGIYRDFQDGSILALESGFFEFIPSDQWDVEQPQTLLAGEVKVGELYRVLVTNFNGFYRYDIKDVVEVIGFHNQTPVIVFRYRLGGLLSSSTEKTTEFHVVQVMQWLQRSFNVQLENFCVTLSNDAIPAHYLVNIELAEGESLANPMMFLEKFDEKLKEVHVSYEVKRRDQVPSPRLRILAPGSFGTVRERLIQRGVNETQIKFPHISEDRQLLLGLMVQHEIRLSDDVPLEGCVVD